MNFYRSMNDVIDVIKKAKDDNVNVNLLIGAGCSASADIPIASGIVELIKNKYSLEYERAESKDYAACMSKLTPIERRKLIYTLVKDANINWTHICIAQLLKHGYIKRIITTNFDNLVQRACSLVGEYPAIYDLATSREFRSDLLFDKSVLHLHGQHTGFILCNTKDEVADQAKYLRNVFYELKKNSLWIVVGYSGNNDAVFNLLCEEKIFEQRLFWVGYKDDEPSQALISGLLNENRYAFFVKGYNSDDFFVTLAHKLNVFPPDIIKKPFSYLNDELNCIMPYKLPLDVTVVGIEDLKNSVQTVVNDGIKLVEENKMTMLKHYLNIGSYDEVIELMHINYNEEEHIIPGEFKNMLDNHINTLKDGLEVFNTRTEITNDYTLLQSYGKILTNIALMEADESKIEQSLEEAYNMFDLAKRLYPNDFVTLNIMGIICFMLSMRKKYKECSKRLLFKAIEINKSALAIKPADENIIRSIGTCYTDITKYSDNDEEKLKYLDEAIRIYEEVRPIHFSSKNILSNYGYILYKKAEIIKGANSIELLKSAYKKFYEVSKLDNNIDNNSFILLNWGFVCVELYKLDCDNQRPELLREAYMKFKALYNLDNNNSSKIFIWFKSLFDIIDIGINNNYNLYQELCTDFVNTLKENIDNYNDAVIKSITGMLNEFAYELIIKGQFEISKEVIMSGFYFDVEYGLLYATLGLWYLRNESVDIKTSWNEGKKQYLKSIKIISSEPRGYLLNALAQKYNYELARFKYYRENNKSIAKQYLKKSINYGEVEHYEQNYMDALELKEILDVMFNDKRVAATKE